MSDIPLFYQHSENSTPSILIAEDNEDNRQMLKFLLEMWNYRVLEASDGYETLHLVRTICPDLILMDARMPGLDGFAVTQLIRRSPGISEVPIFFVSACAEQIYRESALAAGANEYLTKPLVFETLRLAISKYLTP